MKEQNAFAGTLPSVLTVNKIIKKKSFVDIMLTIFLILSFENSASACSDIDKYVTSRRDVNMKYSQCDVHKHTFFTLVIHTVLFSLYKHGAVHSKLVYRFANTVSTVPAIFRS